MAARLTIIDPDGQPGAVIVIARSVTTIGRGECCDLVLDAGGVSRRHARIEHTGEAYTLLDLASKNGVAVNNTRVTRAVLFPGDMIRIGQVRLMFNADNPTSAGPGALPPDRQHSTEASECVSSAPADDEDFVTPRLQPAYPGEVATRPMDPLADPPPASPEPKPKPKPEPEPENPAVLPENAPPSSPADGEEESPAFREENHGGTATSAEESDSRLPSENNTEMEMGVVRAPAVSSSEALRALDQPGRESADSPDPSPPPLAFAPAPATSSAPVGVEEGAPARDEEGAAGGAEPPVVHAVTSSERKAARRAERRRAHSMFLPGVAAASLALLVFLSIVLIVGGLGDDSPDQRNAPKASSGRVRRAGADSTSGRAGDSGAFAGQMDAAFFAYRVHPALLAGCASARCHGPREPLSLVQVDPLRENPWDTIRRNREMLRPYLGAGAARLMEALGKPLPNGGPHGMSAARRDRVREAVRKAISGATLSGHPPVAVISAPTTAVPGIPVVLSSSTSTDPDGETLTSRWALRVRPPESKASLRAAAGTVTEFVPDVPGRYGVILAVSDSRLDSLPAGRMIEIRPPAKPGGTPPGPTSVKQPSGLPAAGGPVAVLDRKRMRVAANVDVALDGSASRTRGKSALAYRWEILDAPRTSARLLEVRGEAASLRVDRQGTFVVALTVSDDSGKTSRATCLIECVADVLDDDTRRLARRVSIELLGRPPSAGELRRWAALFPEDAVRALCASPEFHEAWVERQAQRLGLGSGDDNPRSAVLTGLAGALAEGDIDVRIAVRRMLLGPEARARLTSPGALARGVLDGALGVDPAGEQGLYSLATAMADGKDTAFLDGRGASRTQLIDIALRSNRFFRTLVVREYRRLLGRAPSELDRDDIARRLEKRPGLWPDIVAQWVLSEPYRLALETPRPKPMRALIHGAFMDLAGRWPRREERARWKKRMEPAKTGEKRREAARALLLELLRSPDAQAPPLEEGTTPAAWCVARFRDLLCRNPGPEKLRALSTALEKQGPTAVMEIIALDAEYLVY